jgi:hypothetical protein
MSATAGGIRVLEKNDPNDPAGDADPPGSRGRGRRSSQRAAEDVELDQGSRQASKKKQRRQPQAAKKRQAPAGGRRRTGRALGTGAKSKARRERPAEGAVAQGLRIATAGVGHVTKFLRTRSLGEIASYARLVTRRHPVALGLGLVALGFALSRLPRASEPPSRQHGGRPSDGGDREGRPGPLLGS